jgi:hypothetical protein
MKRLLLSSMAAGMCIAAAAQQPDTARTELLHEIIVTSSQLRDEAPVTLKTITNREITRYIGTKTFPETLRNIGGVYATSESGSYGDAKINIRGFKQENLSVMLNGVPLSGFRSGSMFWNNWLGLVDATYRIQVQKGVGGSALAANSMGGTINIVTKPTDAGAGSECSSSITGDGLYNLRLSLATAETAGGWSLRFIGSRTWGNGYVDATPVDSWGYFLNLQKRFNARHALLFTFFGSPERHGQRSQKLSEAEVAAHGLKYNKNWGAYNGRINNISENFYHKPYFSATHFFSVSDRLFWSNVCYITVGDGGGKWTETGGKSILSYLNPAGQIDWDAVVSGNLISDTAKNIQSDYLAGHTSFGVKSNIDYTLSDALKLSAGVHYQYFYSWQNERITDLLGGKFWYEDYAKNSLAGQAGRTSQKRVGDYIRLNNGDRDNSASLYMQANYDHERIHAFAGAMLTAAAYQHWDKYNYMTDYYSRRVYSAGGNLKAGASLRVAKHHDVYLNGGYYSRMPYSNVYFASNTNDITSEVKNEQNYLSELGYKFTNRRVQFTVCAYYNYWKNKSLMSDPYKQDDEQVRYMITGLDAQHAGVEASYTHRLNEWLAWSAFASLGHWQWKNDVNAVVYDPYTSLPADTLRAFTDGLMVGDAPQTQLGITATLRLFRTVEVRIESRYNDRMYANFDPAKRTNSNDRSQSFRLPASWVNDAHVHFPFRIKELQFGWFLTCNNLFNVSYIERGDDGLTHDASSFRGFWSQGRTVQTGVQVVF